MFDSLLITGIGRYSLGEAVVRDFSQRDRANRVFGMDMARNSDLKETKRFRQVVFNLNPLQYERGFEAFAENLVRTLRLELSTADSRPSCLIQCAGIYESGLLQEMQVAARGRLLGTNILALTEVLYAVMALNAETGISNRAKFTSVIVGSVYGLYSSPKRALYSASKSYGLALAASLAKGNEVSRSIYIAPGPIDTPMLHRNHWVIKANGPERLFYKLLQGNPNNYKRIFIEGDQAALLLATRDCAASETDTLYEVFLRYKAARERAIKERLGVLSPKECARAIIDVVEDEASRSGVYLLRRTEGQPSVSVIAYSDIDQLV